MKPDDGISCLSGGDPCSNPRAESRFFCAPCAAVLDRVGRSISPAHVPRFTNAEARDAFKAAGKAERAARVPDASADEADTRPRSMCRAVGCARPPRDGETTCYLDRGLPEGVNARENVCTFPGCNLAAKTSAHRCRNHPVKGDALAAVAA